MSSPRTTFPTLADTPRDQWPASLRVIPPDSQIIEGGYETIRCACGRAVPASEFMDFRALTVAQRAVIGLELVLCCAACFHLAELHGRVLHSAVAEALGMHPGVIASLESSAREALRRGWHSATDRNRSLAP